MMGESTRSLMNQVNRLKADAGGGECPECGFDGDWSKVGFEVRVDEPDVGPDYCPTCKRPLVIRVPGLSRGVR